MADFVTSIVVMVASIAGQFEANEELYANPADPTSTPSPTPSPTATVYLIPSPIRTTVRSTMVPTPVRAGTPTQSLGVNDHLRSIRYCESRDRYHIIHDSGIHYGAYGFDLPTWQEVGGVGYPHMATPAEQDMRAQMLYNKAGPGRWPHCQYANN